MLDVTPEARVSNVLAKLDKALAAGKVDAAVNLFQDDCYWRDLVAFTWNIKTVEGKEAIRAMLNAQLGAAKPSAFALDEAGGASEDGGVVTGLVHLRNQGRARLRPPPSEGRENLDASDHGRRVEGPRGAARLPATARGQARRRQASPDLEGRQGGRGAEPSAMPSSPMW